MNNRYLVLIEGKRADIFLSILISRGIAIYHKENTKKGITMVVDEEGYKLITSIPTSCSIVVLDRYGLLKIKYLFSKYLGVILGFVFFFFMLFLLSSIIFHIEVIHTSKKIRNMVIEDLEEFGIKKFHFKVSYEEKEEIVSKILEKETDKVEWLEIEEVGVSYVIRVEERKKNL